MIAPGVYVGTLRHRRFTPVAHAFTYRLFMVLLDVDRIGALMQVSRFTSWNRFNWAAFDDRDHLGDPRLPLRERLRSDAARQGVTLPEGRIFLLTHLRYLGYVFNPVSFFYCFDRDDRLALVLAEVHNTLGGARNYWVTPHGTAAKTLYVSPFVPADVEYAFDLSPPGRSLVAHIATRAGGVSSFDATLRLERRPWDAVSIRRALVRHPLMTAAVVLGIHWEAVKLWWKGAPVHDRSTV